MNHLPECAYAIVRDGIVINTVVVGHDDLDLLAAINDSYDGDTEILSCCEHGLAYVGGQWDGTHFRPYQPFPSWNWNPETVRWEAPVGTPTDGTWMWDEANLEWVPAPTPNEVV